MEIRGIELDRDEVFDTATAAIAPFVELVRSLDDSEAKIATLDGSWTTTEVAAHVLTLFQGERSRLAREPRGNGGTPREVDDVNQIAIDHLDDRDPGSLAQRIATEATRGIGFLRSLPPETPLPFWAGVTTDPVSMASVALGEFLIHGHDIASSVGRTWKIVPRHATIISLGIAPLMHGWVIDRRDDATITVTLEGGPTLVYDFRPDGLSVGCADPSRTGEGTVIDPVEFVLAFPYRRIPSDDAIVHALLHRFDPI